MTHEINNRNTNNCFLVASAKCDRLQLADLCCSVRWQHSTLR